MKKSISLVLITVSLVSFALLPNAHAVVPAPDGGYAGGNTAEGQSALLSLTSGTFNTAVGFLSLRSDTEGQFNTAVGAGALLANVGRPTTNQGIENTAVGAGALLSNTTASFNTATGAFALFSNTTGSGNTANGFQALQHNTDGGGNTAIGDGAASNVTTANNVICIGAEGNNVDNSCYIGNIFGSTSSNGVAVLVNSNGRLGTMTSSARFKYEIKPMDKASEVLFALKPVSFHYKKEIDSQRIPQFGLVAEEVEKVNPDLIVRDKEGKPYSVRYDQVNAMLLNEFLKARRQIDAQQKQIEALTAGLQKVNAQLEASKPAPQVVNNP